MKELISHRDTESTEGKSGAFNALMGAFLMFNLVIRFCTIFYYPPYNGYIAAFFGCLVFGCICVALFPKYLKAFLFLFGFSFFLFGFGSIDIQSRVFELIVTCVATALFVINWSAKETHRLNRRLVTLILCYIGLSLFSLFLLPVRQIVKDLWFFGFPDSFYYLFVGSPYRFYYPIPAVIRLMLFVVLAVQLSSIMNCHQNHKALFIGIFSGAVFCAFIGLLEYYGLISLAWYRFGTISAPGVLHSTFQNRGDFAQMVITVIPFVMIGFMSKIKGTWWTIVLFGLLVICEIALILAGARAGWVSYPLILFICWLFFYFSKEGRLESFHFRWKDLVKVAVSVPITIVVSLLLIFQVLMPLSDSLREKANFRGIGSDSKVSSSYLRQQAATMFMPNASSRPMRWRQGFAVGRENVLFGMGYESYGWHVGLLSSISTSHYAKAKGNIAMTPHSIFFQLFVSGGIVGLCLWFLIVGYALMILIVDLIRHKRLLNVPVIISIIGFHTYGIFQSMQYIPMIWLLIFLCLGYAMTIDEGVLAGRVRRVMGVVTKVSVILVVIGLFVYLSNFESRSLAEKYGLKIYAMDQDRDRFGGFYQESKRWKYGDYRWCGKRGSVAIIAQSGKVKGERGEDRGQIRRLHGLGEKGEGRGEKDEHRTSNIERPTSNGGEGEDPSEMRSAVTDVPQLNRKNGQVERGKNFTGQGMVELEFYCRTPGVEEEPVVLTVLHDGKLIDTISFTKKGSIRKKYELPETLGKKQELRIEVSRTWIPHEHLGNFDRRELGIGVKIHEK